MASTGVCKHEVSRMHRILTGYFELNGVLPGWSHVLWGIRGSGGLPVFMLHQA